jgi:hypothetical protein
MHEGVDRIEMMGFVEQKEFGPVDDGQYPKPRVRTCPLEEGIVGIKKPRNESGPVCIDLIEQ